MRIADAADHDVKAGETGQILIRGQVSCAAITAIPKRPRKHSLADGFTPAISDMWMLKVTSTTSTGSRI